MNIVIYGKSNCTYCDMAKQYLDARSIPYDYRQLDVDFVKEELLTLAPNARSYPQIFIDGKNIGGFDMLPREIMIRESVGGDSRQFLAEEN